MQQSVQRCSAALFGVAFIGASVVSACDSQASSDYQGESLLTLQGSVTIGETAVEGELVPALAFMLNNESISVVDVEVNGDFPSSFTLNVFDPPPAHRIGDLAQYPGEPRGCLGLITAVPAVHEVEPAFASLINIMRGSDGAGGVGGGVAGNGGAAAGPCPIDAEWCPDEGECRREHYLCPDQETCNAANDYNGFRGCTLEASEGDPDLAKGLFERFAGMSENYAILYLEEAAPAGSWPAYYYSDDGAIPAGYSLLEITPFEDAPDGHNQVRDRCEWLAEESALQQVFERFEGAISQDEIRFCDTDPRATGSPHCVEYARAIQRAIAQRDCPLDEVTIRVVRDPSNTPINVRIGKNLGFGGGDR